jgi:hypothetical protein
MSAPRHQKGTGFGPLAILTVTRAGRRLPVRAVPLLSVPSEAQVAGANTAVVFPIRPVRMRLCSAVPSCLTRGESQCHPRRARRYRCTYGDRSRPEAPDGPVRLHGRASRRRARPTRVVGDLQPLGAPSRHRFDVAVDARRFVDRRGRCGTSASRCGIDPRCCSVASQPSLKWLRSPRASREPSAGSRLCLHTRRASRRLDVQTRASMRAALAFDPSAVGCTISVVA